MKLVKMRIEWTLDPMTGVLIRRGRDTHRRPFDEGGRDWHVATLRQGPAKFTRSDQKLTLVCVASKDPFLEIPECTQP